MPNQDLINAANSEFTKPESLQFEDDSEEDE
jgi:hypothetical protein